MNSYPSSYSIFPLGEFKINNNIQDSTILLCIENGSKFIYYYLFISLPFPF